ncbi:MAG: DUF6686 family protein [Sediminibacterium sp.]
MCQYQTLYHHAQHGNVLRCTECDQIQVGFGFVLLNLTEDVFYSLHRYLLECCTQPSENRHIRNRILPMPYDGIQLMMSTDELEQFCRMIDHAESELRAQELIRLFMKTQ